MISNAPYLVPRAVTPWQAAAHPASQTFPLIGTVFLPPLVLAYTAFVFWVFRGRSPRTPVITEGTAAAA